MGKTIASRILADQCSGTWASINLRGQSHEYVASTLRDASDEINNFNLRGLIIDDLDAPLEASILENLSYLKHASNRSDSLLVITSASQPNSDFLFNSNLPSEINTTLTEFSINEIEEILEQMGAKGKQWAQYTHTISGGGHPQLATAFIQNMENSGWNTCELQTFNSLIIGSPAVDEVRKRTRMRLLQDLSESERRLIERISLKTGGFSRALVIDLSKIAPTIADAGILLDNLVGSWIDQHEGGRFNLSPLLSDYASKTLTSDEQSILHNTIASSLTRGRKLDLIDMNSALSSAWISKNAMVITKLCMAVFTADTDELEVLSSHLLLFTIIKPGVIAYPDSPTISHMFRGAQLILLNQSSSSTSELKNSLDWFHKEEENVTSEEARSHMSSLVYFKLLMQTSKPGLGVNFIGIIQKLDLILKNNSNEALNGFNNFDIDGINPISFMFMNQLHQLTKINELPVIFDFLDASSIELRSRLLSIFKLDNFDINLLVSGAWLNEHDKNTINSLVHSTVFADLEKQATSWGLTELATCCRKYHAVILDEYGEDKEGALDILEQGLNIYGKTNSELVRAKAKILYRSDDHEGSLALSRTLIESDSPLSDIEKAFLGREAGVSAEKQRNFEEARKFYLYGSEAANKVDIPDMAAMYVGLLADAALTSWHMGNKTTCLENFKTVLKGLNQFEPTETLRTAHCHALSRHVLLWLSQDVNGEQKLLDNGEETRIYPGIVSNPEPSPEISKRRNTPIELAWYQLATIEADASLNLGIIENINQYLPNGPTHEVQMMLASSRMNKAINRLNADLFISSLKDSLSCLAYLQKNKEGISRIDIYNVTYGKAPPATEDQQKLFCEHTEQLVLLYFAACIVKNNNEAVLEIQQKLATSSGFLIRPVISERLQANGPVNDFYTEFAQLIRINADSISGPSKPHPRQVFEFSLKTLQLAKIKGEFRIFSNKLLPWLKFKWEFISHCQRFSLITPSIYEPEVLAVLDNNRVANHIRIIDLLLAILPMLDIAGKASIRRIINDLSNN